MNAQMYKYLLLNNKQLHKYIFVDMFNPAHFIILLFPEVLSCCKMNRSNASNFIIISGSGKKVGKTFLASALIRHFSLQSPIIALKISPHRHDNLGRVLVIHGSGKYRLFRELEVHDKNSGQFLAAGAKDSFFLETEDGFLGEAIARFSAMCNPMDLPVVCESGALGNFLRPGILLYIEDPLSPFSPYKESIKKISDVILPAKQFLPSDIISNIRLNGISWSIKQ
jgi:hypothetical protein